MNLSRVSVLFIIFSCFLVVVPTVQAASIKERMAARIPEINALKDQGLVGENNKGLLEYRSAKKPKKTLIANENKDRSTVYRAIAKSQGAPLDLVVKKRAQMIAQSGKAGHWFQKPNGQWYRK
ncbi:MAG: YdbL family protein [Desulfocapsaceae bacterium]|nr:YdbL family protein [Desulfocapsaceae bacterium]